MAPPAPLAAQKCGRVSAQVSASIDVPLGKAWKVASDFYDLLWVPRVRRSYQIRPGVRYVETYPAADGKVSWVQEKLVKVSRALRVVSYVIVAGNMGLHNYKASLKLSATDAKRTLVEWSFEMDANSPTSKQYQEEVLRRGIQSLEKAARKQH